MRRKCHSCESGSLSGVNFSAFLLCLVVRWFFEERQKRNGCESGLLSRGYFLSFPEVSWFGDFLGGETKT